MSSAFCGGFVVRAIGFATRKFGLRRFVERGPRSVPEQPPTEPKPAEPKAQGLQFETFNSRRVRLAALQHGIGHAAISEEAAIDAAANVVYADLTPIEMRSVDLLLGARKKPRGGADDRTARTDPSRSLN
jgi:hypothetical protein